MTTQDDPPAEGDRGAAKIDHQGSGIRAEDSSPKVEVSVARAVLALLTEPHRRRGCPCGCRSSAYHLDPACASLRPIREPDWTMADCEIALTTVGGATVTSCRYGCGDWCHLAEEDGHE